MGLGVKEARSMLRRIGPFLLSIKTSCMAFSMDAAPDLVPTAALDLAATPLRAPFGALTKATSPTARRTAPRGG